MSPHLTQNLRALGLWVFFLICCSTFSFLLNVWLRLILKYLIQSSHHIKYDFCNDHSWCNYWWNHIMKAIRFTFIKIIWKHPLFKTIWKWYSILFFMLKRFLNACIVNWMVSSDENGGMCMKLRSYIWDSVWVIVWLCIKYWHICFNRYPLTSLII